MNNDEVKKEMQKVMADISFELAKDGICSFLGYKLESGESIFCCRIPKELINAL